MCTQTQRARRADVRSDYPYVRPGAHLAHSRRTHMSDAWRHTAGSRGVRVPAQPMGHGRHQPYQPGALQPQASKEQAKERTVAGSSCARACSYALLLV